MNLVRIFMILTVALSAFAGASSYALSPREVEEAYYSCVSFLKLSRQEQQVIANRTPYSLEQTIWGCQRMAKAGLEESLRLNREIQQAANSSGHARPRAVTCYSAPGCNGGSVSANSLNRCPIGYSSFKSAMGVCHSR